MIEIVIKIPEDSYKATCNGCMLPPDVENVVNAIKNGTPLPKRHGDLIDRTELLDSSYEIDSMYCGYEEVVYIDDIKNAPTIIEADKEDADGK